jgi:hypothetical protein
MSEGKMTIIAIIVITVVGVFGMAIDNYYSNNKACEAAGGVYVKFRNGGYCVNPDIFIKVK